jgi:hypothetical protein
MNKLDRTRISKTVRAFLETKRPAVELRTKLDFGFRFHDQSVELIEIRPKWNGKPGKTEHAFAKAKFVKTMGIWKVYWMRGNLKWNPYEPAPSVGSLEAFLTLVGEDTHHCFFG